MRFLWNQDLSLGNRLLHLYFLVFTGLSGFLAIASLASGDGWWSLFFAGMLALFVLLLVFNYAIDQARLRAAASRERREESVLKSLVDVQHAASEIRADADLGHRAEELDRLINTARTQLTRAAGSALDEGFVKYAKVNSRAANWLILGAVAALLSSAGVAFRLIEDLGDAPGVGQVFARAAITLPGLAVFALLTKDAVTRREHAAWASLTAVQVRQLDGFLEGLPEGTLRDAVRLQFALSVFRGGDIALAGKTKGVQPTSVGDLDIVKAALESTKAAAEAIGSAAKAASAVQDTKEPSAGKDGPTSDPN